MTTDPILDAKKAALRIEARRTRKALQVQHPEAEWMIAGRADELLHSVSLGPGVAALYKALGAEIDPRPLGEALMRKGWRLALPAVIDLEGPLEFRAWAPRDTLAHDLAGLPAPLDSAPPVAPSLILVPLLAFDRRGHRLGQGGGFYDRTFEALRRSPRPPPFVGLAYEGQELDTIPHGPHDQPLDGILTEAGYTAARKDI
ncbi:5-formyltetrahydrofolate cyclo-ligase [Caulobacter sp. NIBR1757]|uniref:5-formyltetrahydrofolate cyclo-ligase n=1 Tax=Caulobacter sp. NIBR1757 TaxID=3016000 RepID=UPI0022F1266D|nr:5-formyltetrahydrofolate cyclo-ligase [Caulobacter sp. NIBR1757]WGM38015.1 5-formyltetrahydrofolate cyclo-ligase [Caulobacter sp. NIBR1757]